MGRVTALMREHWCKQNALMDWLNSLNMDGPRMCEIDLSSAEQISMAIRQVLKPDYNGAYCGLRILLRFSAIRSGDYNDLKCGRPFTQPAAFLSAKMITILRKFTCIFRMQNTQNASVITISKFTHCAPIFQINKKYSN